MKQSAFNSHIELKYNLYNSLFLTLPIDGINNTGIRIPLLHQYCAQGMENGDNPKEIMERFFEDQKGLDQKKEQIAFMFRVIQYIERQIVLVDALEDAAYDKLNDLTGPGSFKALVSQIKLQKSEDKLKEQLKDFSVRTVLTAHPTQFYPGSILGIINDLTGAVADNNLKLIQDLLQQLGKTPFFKKIKPTPFDEAVSLVWFLENVFYQAAGKLVKTIKAQLNEPSQNGIDNETLVNQHLLVFGFWPGGDRDGNPFVNVDTTLRVADRLRFSIVRNLYRDIRKMRRRLTFKGISDQIIDIERTLFKSITDGSPPTLSPEEFIKILEGIKNDLNNDYNGLYAEAVTSLIYQIKIFGYYFASIDIRQDSRVIKQALQEIIDTSNNAIEEGPELDGLFNAKPSPVETSFSDPVLKDTYDALGAMQEIQKRNGVMGCHRYIISNCRNEIDVARVFALAAISGWKKPFTFDIVPLFETIEDLENAAHTMTKLYQHPVYGQHLKSRNTKQPIMLGFSDGTKDGGYLSANWNIYKAKESITKVSREAGIDVVFFDGRGGPPSRGGGNTHKFYASLGNEIENKEIQLTIQGQTISSNFGTPVSAHHNIELLMTAGLQNQLIDDPSNKLSSDSRKLLEELSRISLDAYSKFKAHEKFVPYLEKMSALKYYGMAKIGSRPSKRKASAKLKFEDLRAIPFVGAWSQLKQNVPGFYGVGTALHEMKKDGRLQECKDLYTGCSFFRALMENAMMAMSKTYFPLTEYMKNDPEFGSFWDVIHDEFELSRKLVLAVSGQTELMETNQLSKSSIALRERIILPLVIIQQYALMSIQQLEQSNQIESEAYKIFQKLVVRSLYGNINASRNSA